MPWSAGTCDGMTYEEIEREYPDEWQRRKADKLAYRYSIPQGVRKRHHD